MAAESDRATTLLGRAALVTGAGSDGMGRAIARAFAHAGADIAIHYHGAPDGAATLAAELGRRVHAIEADFADPRSARGAVRQAIRELGKLDILVSNAAVLLRKPFLETTDAEWQNVHAINLHAYFAAGQEAARHMIGNGGGRIVFISSINQWRPNAGLAAYGAAKGGVMQLARTMALELAPHRITVNLIAPGTIETDFNRAALADPAYRKMKQALIPAARIGTPDDVAAAALYLAGDAAAYVTGSTVTVDGGLSL
ncbi:MAG: glucose 1-dehydrogenase [Alphaproteobacteria bacterium]|nr:glucose 1-dehydrogenase [Alphaproteobacteria bacterium]